MEYLKNAKFCKNRNSITLRKLMRRSEVFFICDYHICKLGSLKQLRWLAYGLEFDFLNISPGHY